MLNDVYIANLALSKIGGRKIDSFTEGTPEAQAASLHYDPTRRELLSAFAWGFATKTRELPRLLEDPANLSAFLHCYGLPDDFLLALDINDRRLLELDIPYYIGQARLECDLESVKLRYTADINATEKFPAYFTEALACHLAAKMAVAVTGVGSAGQNFTREAVYKTSLAMTADANSQGIRRVRIDSELVRALRGN